MADTPSKLGAKLLEAVSKGETDRIEYFLSEKADVNYQNAAGLFPLLLATLKGSKSIVKLLLDVANAEIKVDLVSKHGMTCLSLACERGHFEIVELLVEKGANVDHPVSDGRTLIMLASQNGHSTIIDYFLSKSTNNQLINKSMSVYGKDGLTLLMLASAYGRTDSVDFLLQKGAQIDLQSSNGYTALMWASSNGQVEVAKKLIEKGAKIDLRTSDGHSALIIATQKEHAEVVKVLLDHGSEVDLSLHYLQETALMIACKNNNFRIAELLLLGESQQSVQDLPPDSELGCKTQSRPADVNLENWYGYTALTYACMGGNVELVKLLIQRGANVNPLACKTPLHLATKHGHTDVVEVLLQSKAITNPPSDITTDTDGIRTYKYNGIPPLTLATVYKHTKIAQLLLEYGAQVDVVYGDKRHMTPLMYAIIIGNHELVKLLCKHNASPQFESTPKPNCGYYSLTFTCKELADANNDHAIISILTTCSVPALEENSDDCHSDPEAPQAKKRKGNNTLQYGSHELRRRNKDIMQLVEEEFKFICPEFQTYDRNSASSLIDPKYATLSNLLPKEPDRTSIDNPTETLESKELSTSNVLSILRPMASEWDLIGTFLGINDGIIKAIEKDHRKSTRCLMEMIRVWLKTTDPYPSWEILADAIKNSENPKLSEEILAKYT